MIVFHTTPISQWHPYRDCNTLCTMCCHLAFGAPAGSPGCLLLPAPPLQQRSPLLWSACGQQLDGSLLQFFQQEGLRHRVAKDSGVWWATALMAGAKEC